MMPTQWLRRNEQRMYSTWSHVGFNPHTGFGSHTAHNDKLALCRAASASSRYGYVWLGLFNQRNLCRVDETLRGHYLLSTHTYHTLRKSLKHFLLQKRFSLQNFVYRANFHGQHHSNQGVKLTIPYLAWPRYFEPSIVQPWIFLLNSRWHDLKTVSTFLISARMVM